MPEPKNSPYPVGWNPTPEQLAAIDPNSLDTRGLNDPRFAGFDSNFNWHQYVDNQVLDDNFNQKVGQELDRMASTPEGQQTIRQAYAEKQAVAADLKLHPEHAGTEPQFLQLNGVDPDQQSAFLRAAAATPKLVITDGKDSEALRDQGMVILDKDEIANTSYMGVDGETHPFTVGHVLDHEMDHEKDPLREYMLTGIDQAHDNLTGQLAAAKKQSIALQNEDNGLPDGDPRHEPILQQEAQLNKTIDGLGVTISNHEELPAIADAGIYQEKYLGEVPRSLDHRSAEQIAADAATASPAAPVQNTQASQPAPAAASTSTPQTAMDPMAVALAQFGGATPSLAVQDMPSAGDIPPPAQTPSQPQQQQSAQR